MACSPTELTSNNLPQLWSHQHCHLVLRIAVRSSIPVSRLATGITKLGGFQTMVWETDVAGMTARSRKSHNPVSKLRSYNFDSHSKTPVSTLRSHSDSPRLNLYSLSLLRRYETKILLSSLTPAHPSRPLLPR